MINLTVNEIILMHEKLIRKTGGMPGLRDKQLLESAVYSTMQSFGEVDIYPTPYERSARLAFSIIMNHAFIDGNKRIGILVMLTFLKLNNIVLDYTQQELISLGLSIACGKMNYPDIVKWIKTHTS